MKLKKKSKIEVDEKLSKYQAEASGAEGENEFMNPVKRGRPAGAKNKPKLGESTASPMGLDADNVAKIKTYITPVVDMCSEMGYRVAEDEKARLSPNEAEIITSSAASCINLYLPNVMGRHADLIVLSVTMAQWSARVYMLRQMNLAKLRRQHSPKGMENNADEVNANLGGEIMQ